MTLIPSPGRRRQSGVLEDTPSSPRELNRAARRASSRRATRRMLLAALAALAIVVAAVAASWVVLSSQEEPAPLQPAAAPSGGASAAVVITDNQGTAASIALLGTEDDFASELVLFPPALLTTVPGFGEAELGDVTRFGGQGLARHTLMNLLGIRVDGALVISAEDFAQAVGIPLAVDLPNALIISEGTSQVVAIGEGASERSPAELARLLSEQGTADQLAWLVRQGAVWEAVLLAAEADPMILERLGAQAGTDAEAVSRALVGTVSDSERQVVAAAVRPVERPGGDVELYDLPGDSVTAIATVQFPYLRIGEAPRVRVEVLNGNGLIGTTHLVAEELIAEGFWVVRTDNADAFDYETTKVIAQGRENQRSALEVQRLLTLGEVEVEQRQPSGVVDLTIIVGGDLPSGSSDGP
ncbi:MAG: LCP family protein [Acidimicrobiia bacterium]